MFSTYGYLGNELDNLDKAGNLDAFLRTAGAIISPTVIKRLLEDKGPYSLNTILGNILLKELAKQKCLEFSYMLYEIEQATKEKIQAYLEAQAQDTSSGLKVHERGADREALEKYKVLLSQVDSKGEELNKANDALKKAFRAVDETRSDLSNIDKELFEERQKNLNRVDMILENTLKEAFQLKTPDVISEKKTKISKDYQPDSSPGEKLLIRLKFADENYKDVSKINEERIKLLNDEQFIALMSGNPLKIENLYSLNLTLQEKALEIELKGLDSAAEQIKKDLKEKYPDADQKEDFKIAEAVTKALKTYRQELEIQQTSFRNAIEKSKQVQDLLARQLSNADKSQAEASRLLKEYNSLKQEAAQAYKNLRNSSSSLEPGYAKTQEDDKIAEQMLYQDQKRKKLEEEEKEKMLRKQQDQRNVPMPPGTKIKT